MSPTTSPGTGRRSIVRLHGKGATGADAYVEDGVLNVLPSGNAAGWGGRQWLYFPEDRYRQARAIVAEHGVDGSIVILVRDTAPDRAFARAVEGELLSGGVSGARTVSAATPPKRGRPSTSKPSKTL